MAEGKTCKDTEGVTITEKDKMKNIVDCATACKAKLQNTMFAYGKANNCGIEGCTCQCIEAEKGDCAKSPNADLTLYKFRGSVEGKTSLLSNILI